MRFLRMKNGYVSFTFSHASDYLVVIDKQTAVKPEEPDIWKILILLNLTHHKRMKLQKKIRALKMKVQTQLQFIMHYSIKDCL